MYLCYIIINIIKIMKTLWQRLSEDNRFKIKSSPYAYLSSKLEAELSEKGSWTDLKFQSIIFLMQETTNEPTTIDNVSKLFKND